MIVIDASAALELVMRSRIDVEGRARLRAGHTLFGTMVTLSSTATAEAMAPGSTAVATNGQTVVDNGTQIVDRNLANQAWPGDPRLAARRNSVPAVARQADSPKLLLDRIGTPHPKEARR